MLEQAKKNIEKYAFGKRVAVAVSGGEDSMALLSLMLGFARAGKLELLCINVEHGIRPESSDDSKFVEDFCCRNGVEFIGRTVDVPSKCALSGRGVECEAHFARREFFAEVLESGRADLVATAHHARDNVETVLMHLFRGCGLKGLSGMPVITDSGLFRPLVNTPKEEICAYVRTNGIEYVTDVTNADTAYSRNYIRSEILPRIRERFPAAERAILRTAEYAAEACAKDREALDYGAFEVGEGYVSLDEKFLSPPYVTEALALLGKTSDVYGANIDRVCSLGGCRPCARADVCDGIVAAREYGAITFYRPTASAESERGFALPEARSEIELEGGSIKVCRVSEPYFPAEKGELVFDGDKLPDGTVLRRRKDGDRFIPYGGGSRKLKEYLIDKKIPARLRSELWLVCEGNEVLMIVGREISDRIKVDGASTRVYSVRWQTNEKN